MALGRLLRPPPLAFPSWCGYVELNHVGSASDYSAASEVWVVPESATLAVEDRLALAVSCISAPIPGACLGGPSCYRQEWYACPFALPADEQAGLSHCCLADGAVEGPSGADVDPWVFFRACGGCRKVGQTDVFAAEASALSTCKISLIGLPIQRLSAFPTAAGTLEDLSPCIVLSSASIILALAHFQSSLCSAMSRAGLYRTSMPLLAAAFFSVPLLRGDPGGKLKATTIIEWLAERHPDRFSASQLRTLQRRLQPLRQAQEAGAQRPRSGGLLPPGASSWQGGPDRLHPRQLPGSDHREPATGETFLALQQGLQAALWTLGGVPQVIRSDNTSAATHEMGCSRGRALNDAYQALLDHYGLRSTRINPGQSHENGVAEQGHYRLKDAIGQALILRGSRDFHTADDYALFVSRMVQRHNRLIEGKLEQELACLRPLPPAPMPEYVNYRARVRKWSTVQVAGRTYTVPSRLIGKEVQIRLYADWVEVYYKGAFVERMERVRGEREARVDYRHIIGSLVRKPGAFARYRFREQMFPTMTFRLAYDALREWCGERADVEYVRILHLAATTMESTVDSALALLLETGDPFDYGTVKELANPTPPLAPVLTLSGIPDLRVYDSLLAEVA